MESADCTITGPVLDDQAPQYGVARTGALLARTVTDDGLAMVVLNSGRPDGTVTVRSWAVHELAALPGTAAQARLAHCISEDRDEPAPGFQFVDAPELV
ncbi:hypothetical protein ACWCQL_38080 [Streptomyces sp. NPDC002073]